MIVQNPHTYVVEVQDLNLEGYEFYCVADSQGVTYLFYSPENAQDFIDQKLPQNTSIKAYPLEKILWDIVINPCSHCGFKGKEVVGPEALRQGVLEDLSRLHDLLQKSKIAFENLDLKTLLEESKIIIDHFDRSNPTAHFYLAFYYFRVRDAENFQKAKENVKNLSSKLFGKLQELEDC